MEMPFFLTPVSLVWLGHVHRRRRDPKPHLVRYQYLYVQPAKYGERWIGDQIDLNIYPGGTLLLLDPSGCCKSTVILALSGLAGQLAGKIGIVFQDPDAQVVTGSLLDEVCFGLENLLGPVDEIETRALATLPRTGLADSREEALSAPPSCPRRPETSRDCPRACSRSAGARSRRTDR